MSYEHARLELANLKEKIQSLRNQLRRFPEKNLYCTKNGTRFKWYQSDGHTSSYLPKSQRPLAEELAQKKYLSLQLEDLLEEQKALELYLNYYLAHVRHADQSLWEHNAYRELLLPHLQPLSKELAEWAASPFERNRLHPEQLNQKTISGIYVRSKSEALISTILSKYQIPFRYECALRLKSVILYPDFTIRHPDTGNIYYWEHFGLMDVAEYSQNAFQKLSLYASCGIIPSIQLITTYETKANPLNIETVDKLVQEFLAR